MGLFDFVKNAGKAMGIGDDYDEKAAAADAKIKELREQRMANALHKEVEELGIPAENLSIEYRDGKATVRGATGSQADRERLILALGNVDGVGQVDDGINVRSVEPESAFYTVQRGDTLSGIAKEHYGSAGKYMAIFEANQPLLKDPDRIYPGQVLRIPPLES
jgi:nucleoid-associated protein YgaU